MGRHVGAHGVVILGLELQRKHVHIIAGSCCFLLFREVPEQGVSRLGFVPAKVGWHVQDEVSQAVLIMTLRCCGGSGTVLEGLKSWVALSGQEAQLAARPPPGFGRDVQLGEQQRPQDPSRTPQPGVFSDAASWRSARGGTGRVVRGGRAAGVGVGAGVASLPTGRRGPGGRPAGREVRSEGGNKPASKRGRQHGREDLGRRACT